MKLTKDDARFLALIANGQMNTRGEITRLWRDQLDKFFADVPRHERAYRLISSPHNARRELTEVGWKLLREATDEVEKKTSADAGENCSGADNK